MIYSAEIWKMMILRLNVRFSFVRRMTKMRMIIMMIRTWMDIKIYSSVFKWKDKLSILTESKNFVGYFSAILGWHTDVDNTGNFRGVRQTL